MKKERGNLNFELWQMVQHSLSAATKARQMELIRYGTTIRQSGVLHAVVRLGQQATPSEIARQLFLESNTIAEQLNRMEDQGLVRRVKDLHRRNLVRIELTHKGYDLCIKASSQKSIDDMLSMLTEREKLELWSALAKIRDGAARRLRMKKVGLYPPSDPTGVEFCSKSQGEVLEHMGNTRRHSERAPNLPSSGGKGAVSQDSGTRRPKQTET